MQRLKLLLFLSLTAITMVCVSSAGAAQVNWVADWPTAAAQSKSTGKPIMVDMYTSWCTWCKRLDSDVYPDNNVVAASGNFVCVKLDAEHEGQALAQRYQLQGFPTILFLDPSGNLIDEIVGFQPAPNFTASLNHVTSEFVEYPKLQQAVQLNPKDMNASALLFPMELSRQNWVGAEELLSNVSKYGPKTAVIPLQLAIAQVLAQDGQVPQAKVWLSKVANSPGASAKQVIAALFALGECDEAMGDRASETAVLRKILSNPGAPHDLKLRIKQFLAQLAAGNS